MAIFDVVQAPNQASDDLVQRVPEQGSGSFNMGSQVVVRENQAAVFFRDGKALDVFPPGRHTITTNNIPLLSGLLGRFFGGQTPFTAEVYFVNLATITDLKWGTPEPISLRDRDLGLARLRAFGTYTMKVADPQLFVTKIVGTNGLYNTSQIEDLLRGILVSNLTDVLGETGKGLFDLPAMFNELGAGLRVKCADDFANLGITLLNCYIQSVSPTDETAKAIDERASMGAIGDMQRYTQFQAARALGDAARNQSGGAVGTGVGLGAGIGLGGVMAGAIRDAVGGSAQSSQQQAPQQQAPAAASAGGALTRQQVQDTLDSLDIQLAQGKISEDTYNRLRQRWEDKLKELGA